MSKIGDKSFEEIGQRVEAILKGYRTKINQAYNAADEELAISLKISISPGKRPNSTFDMEIKIGFITEKITDNFKFSVEELQTDMFKGEEKAAEATAATPEEKAVVPTGRSRGRAKQPQEALPDGQKMITEGEVVDAEFKE